MNDIEARATLNFRTDLDIWGCSLWGDSDPTALISEWPDHYWHRGPLWDTMGIVQGWTVNIEGAYVEPPLRWSLPYVQQQIWQRTT